LLSGMKDASAELEKARNKKDIEGVNQAKREIMVFHKEINRLL